MGGDRRSETVSKRNGNGAHALKLDPHNARKHPDRNKAQIAASLKELGAGRSILVDATDTIIAGNGVYEQAQALGYKVKVIEADGKTLIAVKRPDLKGAKARRMALADNRATETSEWDTDVLADIAANDADALAGLFDERELRDLLGDKMPGGKEETADADQLVDRAGELQKKWGTELGQVWEIGKHRIVCGDSTDPECVKRLMGGGKGAIMFYLSTLQCWCFR